MNIRAKQKTTEVLHEYFSKSGPMTLAEYIKLPERPVRIQIIRNLYGSWNLMQKVLESYGRKAKLAVKAEEPSGKKVTKN